jgi:hypothetical protein
MSHYVWQMNDGRWHISRETHSMQPRLICEMQGSFDTRQAAQAALDTERKAVRLVVTRDDENRERFYTGRAGRDYLSPDLRDAFAYVTDEGAERKAATFNDMLDPMRFTVRPLCG